MKKSRERPLQQLTLREHMISLKKSQMKSRGIRKILLSMRMKRMQAQQTDDKRS